jgi:thiamine biosynthesis protein ThiS
MNAQILVNGKPFAVALPCSVGQFIERNGWKPTQVVVEHNGQVAPRGQVGVVFLSEGDRLEVILPVAGG